MRKVICLIGAIWMICLAEPALAARIAINSRQAVYPVKQFVYPLGGDASVLRFGMGVSTSTIFTSLVDQKLFPGFTVSSSWSNYELILELRGRFFFGDIDAYQVEAAGYRSVTNGKSGLFVGGGAGYGGMNLKELLVFDINGQPVPGIFFHNGKGIHSFVGINFWIKQAAFYSVKVDFDYFVSLYNLDRIHAPTGLRFSLTLQLHAPDVLF